MTPSAFPTNFATRPILFWGGLSLIVISTAILVRDHLIRSRLGERKKVGPVLLAYAGWVLVLAGFIWHVIEDQNRRQEMAPVAIPNPAVGSASAIPDANELGRRSALWQRLRQEYILSHDNLSPALLAGTADPPASWINERLSQLGEGWRIMESEPRGQKVDQDVSALFPLVEELRRNQAALSESAHTRDVLGRIFSQYDQLKSAIDLNEKFLGAQRSSERLAAAEHIIGELRAILGNVQDYTTPQGKGLILKAAPNTFRVTFPVPMRIPPSIVFRDLPAGSTANIIEKSTIGFTVVFTPPTIRIEKLPALEASAEF